MARRSLTGTVAALALLAVTANGAAADIYRCEGDGPKTLVDSPRHCPGGQAVRVNAPKPKPKPQVIGRLPEASSPTASAPASAPAPTTATHTTASGRPAHVCEPHRFNPSVLDECLKTERRKHVRAVATERLAKLGDAVSEFATLPLVKDGLITIRRDHNRPPAWCEAFLGDVIAQRNLEVVDDEGLTGPRWIDYGTRPLRAAPILDEDFSEWTPPGGPVVRGHVTVMWRKRMVVLRAISACSLERGHGVRCHPLRYTGLAVHDDEMPQACQVSFVERPYWNHWRDSMVEIRLKPR